MDKGRLRIGIIGGGCSGVLLTVHLARTATGPIEIYLIERAPPFARGTAYAATHPLHLLNSPAARMSAFNDDPTHFVRWLQRTSAPCARWSGCEFVPRGRYGQYLGELLTTTRSGDSPARVHLVSGTAVAIEVGRNGSDIVLDVGTSIGVDHAVLCTGFARQRATFGACAPLRETEHFIADPWDDGERRRIARDDSVLIVGTGLTMVDIAVELATRGHRGWIHAVSRHGLLPAKYVAVEPYPPFLDGCEPPQSIARQLALVRGEVAHAAALGIAWQSVIEALRPRVQDCWRALRPTDRRRFLRHLRPYWEIHRHRMAPDIGARVADLRASGLLSVSAARIVDVTPGDPIGVSLRPRGRNVVLSLEADWVIDATGGHPADQRSDRLIANLVANRLARPDPLGLGIEVTPGGALIGADGVPSYTLFAVGAPTRGALWDVTGVAELRRQCAALAASLTQAPAYA
jgi:uncharacterized NAD(P)/FAD-binding protein YdhS